MHYLIYRIKESNGFIAKRCFLKAMCVVMVIYGESYSFDGRILLPELIYK